LHRENLSGLPHAAETNCLGDHERADGGAHERHGYTSFGKRHRATVGFVGVTPVCILRKQGGNILRLQFRRPEPERIGPLGQDADLKAFKIHWPMPDTSVDHVREPGPCDLKARLRVVQARYDDRRVIIS